MSDFFHPSTVQLARRRRRCTWCGQHVEVGERYVRQGGVFESSYFTNRLHCECWQAAGESGEEYCPYDNERPGAADRRSPERIQLQRTKGWRMPAGAIKVDRTTAWGNPFKPTDVCVTSAPGEAIGLAGAVRAFRASWLHKLKRWPDETESQLAQIRGKSLACWCKRGALCHADVLLELANAVRPA